MDKTNLLTISEMAVRLKVHPSWLYSRTRETGEGTIPRIKIGKYIRFNESEVFEWLRKKQDEA
jgi:excisionase family DNA binding protein